MTDLVEQVARAICREAGYNPDARVYGNGAFHFVWEKYKPHAKTSIDMALKEAADLAEEIEEMDSKMDCSDAIRHLINGPVTVVKGRGYAELGKADIKNIELAKAGLAGVPYQAYTETRAMKGMDDAFAKRPRHTYTNKLTEALCETRAIIELGEEPQHDMFVDAIILQLDGRHGWKLVPVEGKADDPQKL